MKTFGFITALLFAGMAVFARQPGDGPVPAPPADVSTPPAADDQENAATVELLTSGPWKITGQNWSSIRIFDKDGTFHTKSKPREHGKWQITDADIELIFADGHKDTLALPLHPAGTPGTGALGGAAIAVLMLPDKADSDQEADIATPPELLKLRHGYVDALNNLLGQYTKDRNHAGVVAATREIDKVSPCGVWKWDGKPIRSATIHPDGTVTENSKTEDKNSKDAWHWVDEVKGRFQINWDSGWVDNITLLPDGNTLLIKSNAGKKYTVHRLLQGDTGAPAS